MDDHSIPCPPPCRCCGGKEAMSGPRFELYKRLQWPNLRGVSFIHHGDFRVAAVPESLSLLHSYLRM